MTEDELNDYASELLTDSMLMNHCERNGRHYCCSYHEGFEDGMDMLIERMMKGTSNA